MGARATKKQDPAHVPGGVTMRPESASVCACLGTQEGGEGSSWGVLGSSSFPSGTVCARLRLRQCVFLAGTAAALVL